MENRYTPDDSTGEGDDAEAGRRLAREILHHGAEHPIDSGPLALPVWYNHDLVTNGQEYFRKNRFNMFVAKLSGLLSLLASPTIARVLQKTDQSSEPCTAYKRYMATITHMLIWYETDFRNPESKAWNSLREVRGMHRNASMKFGGISQLDLALTQFGFIGFAVHCRERLGLQQDQSGLIHFWRVIGHLIGLQDRFNLFRGGLDCSVGACEELARAYFVPYLESPPSEFGLLSTALLEGMWPVIVFYSPPAFQEHARRLVGCPPKPLNSPIAALFLQLQMFVHRILQIESVAFFLTPFLNFQLWFTIWVQHKMPLLAYLSFGKAPLK